jgi:hypothetical protein
MTFCNNLGLCLNLLYFAILWSVGFFGYYLLNFQLKYLPGNIHANNVASGLSELISIILPLYLERLGVKISMILALLMTVIGGLLIMISGYGTLVNAFLVLLARTGAVWLINTCQLVTSIVFPVHLRSKSYGFCELTGRFVLIMCPIIAE